MNLQDIVSRIGNLLNKFQLQAVLILFVIALALGSVTLYLRSNGLDNIKKMNRQRAEISTLLGRWESIKTQQKKVEEALGNAKNFKLGHYVNTLAKEQNLNATNSAISSQPLLSLGYEELAITTTVENSTTEDLVELLQKIEKNGLVYIKKVEITPKNKRISYSLTLATLQPKATNI